jgi:beta-lactamase class A
MRGEAVDLDAVPGNISVWLGPLGGPPRLARLPDQPHYAASLMKLPVLAALHRHGDPNLKVRVVNEFASALPSAPGYGLDRRHDADDAVWARLGRPAPLGWLAHRMITRSSNLAANLVLANVGIPAVDQVWREVGATVSHVRRGIGDTTAEQAGLTNTVSAADAAALLATLRDVELKPMLDQRRTEDLAAGLPPGTRVAHKNGWVRGVRHAVGIVYPDDAAAFVLAVCTTTPLAVNDPDDEACRLIRTLARSAWEAELASRPASKP